MLGSVYWKNQETVLQCCLIFSLLIANARRKDEIMSIAAKSYTKKEICDLLLLFDVLISYLLPRFTTTVKCA